MRRKLLIIILVLFVQLITGCYYSTYSRSDPFNDPMSAISSIDALKSAKKYCSSFNKKFYGLKLRDEHSINKKAYLILSDIEKIYSELSKGNLFNYYENNSHPLIFDEWLPNELRPKLNIKIFAFCTPLAVSYPNGQINLSRSFIDGGLSFSAKNKAQLTGLLAHEYIHIKHGHVKYRWVIADSYNRFRSEQRKTNWTRYLRILPISYSSTVDSTRDMKEINLIDYQLECMADFYTAILLYYMGYDINEYIKLLKGLRTYLSGLEGPNKKKLNELSCRIYSLEKLSEIDKINFPDYLVIEIIREDGSIAQYIGYSFEKHPILKKYAAYWTYSLRTMNKNVYQNVFVIYENQAAIPLSKVKNPHLPVSISGNIVKPSRIVKALVLPEKLIELPIFGFLYKSN